jgi:hypothetical protein
MEPDATRAVRVAALLQQRAMLLEQQAYRTEDTERCLALCAMAERLRARARDFAFRAQVPARCLD